MTSHVYILAHRTEPRFKIGKANDIAVRAKAFGLPDIDLERSVGLEVVNSDEANRLERLLHRAFARWRLTRDEVLAASRRAADGATEWFRAACRERLETFLAANKDLMDFVIVPGQQLAKTAEPSVAREQARARRAVQVARRPPREERWERQLLAIERSATAMKPQLEAIVAELLETGRIAAVTETISETPKLVLLLHGRGDWRAATGLMDLRLYAGMSYMALASSSAHVFDEGQTAEIVCFNIGIGPPSGSARNEFEAAIEKHVGTSLEVFRTSPRLEHLLQADVALPPLLLDLASDELDGQIGDVAELIHRKGRRPELYWDLVGGMAQLCEMGTAKPYARGNHGHQTA